MQQRNSLFVLLRRIVVGRRSTAGGGFQALDGLQPFGLHAAAGRRR